MNDLTNTNGVGVIDPKDTINIPENAPFPTSSASGLPQRAGETAVIHGGPASTVQATRDAEKALRDSDYADPSAPVGANETTFNGTGESVPTAPIGTPFGVERLDGSMDWFATEELATQYADSNPGYFRIKGESIEADPVLSDHVAWSKGMDGQLHQFANEKTRQVMLDSEPLLGYVYEPTQAEIDAWTGVIVSEADATEKPDAPRDTIHSMGPVSRDGKFYAWVDSDIASPHAFENESDRDAYVASTPGSVAYTLPAE